MSISAKTLQTNRETSKIKQTNKQNTKTKQTNKTSKVSVIVIVSLAYLQISWCTNARSHLNIKRTVSSEDILCW